jgi:hypothetical protein
MAKKKKKPEETLDCYGPQYIGIGKISLMRGLGDLGKW